MQNGIFGEKDFNRVIDQGQSYPKIVRDTLPSHNTHSHTRTHAKFGIPTSNNIGDILRTRLF